MNNWKSIFLLIFVIFVFIWFISVFSDPCTRPYPNAQAIIDCQKQQIPTK